MIVCRSTYWATFLPQIEKLPYLSPITSSNTGKWVLLSNSKQKENSVLEVKTLYMNDFSDNNSQN